MDAVEYEKYRIKMRKETIRNKGGCGACEMYDVVRQRCRTPASVCMKEDEDYYKKNVAIVEQWAKDHPVKTRQSEFLKMFPNADMQRINTLFPCIMDQTTKPARCVKYERFSSPRKCVECRKDYWIEEVNN